MSIASRITYSNLTAAVVIADGGSIKVSAIVITNTTAAAIEYTITDNAASPATLMLVQVAADSTLVIAGASEFLFDKGLRFAAAASTSHITVFHSQQGV